MYKGLSRLGILTIILSLLIVPAGLSTRTSTKYSWQAWCPDRDIITYVYTKSLSYDSAAEVTFAVHVKQTVKRYRTRQKHEHHGSCMCSHNHAEAWRCQYYDTIVNN